MHRDTRVRIERPGTYRCACRRIPLCYDCGDPPFKINRPGRYFFYMKRLLAFLFVALNAMAWGQAAAAPPSAPAQTRPAPPVAAPSPHPEAVGASEAVITVHGMCPNLADKSSAA